MSTIHYFVEYENYMLVNIKNTKYTVLKLAIYIYSN